MSAIVPALVSGLGSVLGGLFDWFGGSEANETNLQAVRETNAQNYKIFQEQLGFNREMFDKTNAYNAPAEQRKRFEAAGINPYLALGNMESGNASMQTSPSAPQMQAPHVEPVSLGSAFSQGVPSAMDTYIKSQQAESLGIDNKSKLIQLRYKETNEIMDLYNKRADLESKRVKTDADRKQIDFLDAQIAEKRTNLKYLDGYLGARNDRERNEANRAEQEAQEAHWKAQYQKVLAETLPNIQRATLNLLANQAYSAYAAGVASMEQGKTTYKLRPLQILEQTLKNGLAANQFTLSDLGLSEAQLEQARKAGVIEYRNGHPVIKHLDNFVNWFGNSVGSVLRGIFK